MRGRHIACAGAALAVAAGLLVVQCTESDSGGTGLRAPTVAELIGVWRVIRASQNETGTYSGAYTDQDQSSFLDISATEVASYALDEDEVPPCYCPVTTPYALSGNSVTGDAYAGDTTEDGMRMTWSTTWAIQGGQLALTISYTLSGGDTDGALSGPASMSATMTAYYDAYTGALPTNLCAVGCEVGFFKEQQPAGSDAAANITGRWVLARTQFTEQYSGSMSGTITDFSWLFEVTSDSIYEYENDTSWSTTCYYRSGSDYVLDGSTLKGDDYYYVYEDTEESERLSTTIGFNASGELVVEAQYSESAVYTDGADSETYAATGGQTLYMVAYDGPLPPASWPQLQCGGVIFKQRADSQAVPAAKTLRERVAQLPVTKILTGK